MPPRRPESLEDLSFERRRPVSWFSPPVLARSGVKVVLSAVFGDYLDKREMQQSLPGDIVESPIGSDEVWVDFVSDSGDGFDATYSVAWCVSQRSIQPDGLEGETSLPRADFVVFGGDEVYPFASPKEYEDRFVGPYASALPWTQATTSGPDDPHPRLLAIPGNHDWYDGLTGFMRLFAQGGWIGGRRLAQTRSYFAIDLPGRHWLWGIDIGNDAYVDAAQIKYFRDAAAAMQDGDRLILCTAKPSWSNVDRDPTAYRNLRFVERQLVPPNGPTDDRTVETVLMASGDKHYYSRHERMAADGSVAAGDDRRVKITAGGGGAFLSATHDLGDVANVPQRVPLTQPERSDLYDRYELQEEPYPTRAQSRRLTWRALLLGVYNRVFLVVTALINLLLFAANTSGLRTEDMSFDERADGWGYTDLLLGGLRSPATIILLLTLTALLVAFADGTRLAARAALGIAHTAAHVAAHALVAWCAIGIFGSLDGRAFVVAVTVFVIIVGAVVGSVVFGLYLAIALNVFGRHDTEAFSAFRYDGYKNFLRMRISDDGITVYAIGIDEVCHDWVADPDAVDVEAAHIAPKSGSIRMRLIDDPIELR